MIRLFHRTVHLLLPDPRSCLALLPFFSLLVLGSPNYSPGYTFSGFHGLWFGDGRVGRGGGVGAPLSHLESNRGPLSKKLISLNIILGASGSRRALTDPSGHPRALPPPAAKPRCLSPTLRFCTANSVPATLRNRFAPFRPSPSPRPSSTLPLIF